MTLIRSVIDHVGVVFEVVFSRLTGLELWPVEDEVEDVVESGEMSGIREVMVGLHSIYSACIRGV